MLLFVLLSAGILISGTIRYTSFQEPPVFPGTQYVDTGDSKTDHPLVNNPDQPYVNYTSTGGELGFSSYYFNTRNDTGLTDGDYVGVTDYAFTVGSFPDGTQGFELSDCDGMMTVSFDEVDLSGYSSAYVSVAYFVQSTGWESGDSIRIWVVVDGGTEIDLLNTAGSDIDDLNIEGAWDTLEVDLSGYTTAVLKIQLDSNSSSEALYVDNVIFSDQPISSIRQIAGEGIIQGFRLYPNFPNPFNPSTTLRFDVPRATDRVELVVYDMLGKKVKTLFSGSLKSGRFEQAWNGRNEAGIEMPTGVYFAVLKSDNYRKAVKMMLLR